MKSKTRDELSTLMDSAMVEVDQNELPRIISSQVEKLNELDGSVKRASQDAEKAKSSAQSAKNKSAGLFKKQEAIEMLQSATVDVADAIQSQAEAQKLSFEFQAKLSEISRYLFGLGVGNIAHTRSVVRELELHLKNASEEELTELARKEILTVVRQLREQEDIHERLEKIATRLIDQDGIIENQSKIILAHEYEIKRLQEQNKELMISLEEEKYVVDHHEEVTKAINRRILTNENLIQKLNQHAIDLLERVDAQSYEIDSNKNLIAELDQKHNAKANRKLVFILFGITCLLVIIEHFI